MSRVIWRRCWVVSVLFTCAVSGGADADPLLADFDYPHPVQRYQFQSQGQSLTMAYMDVRPSQPSGKTVVLLHGKNFCGATWEDTIGPLRDAGYRVVVPDQVGFCKSTKPQAYQFGLHQLAANTHPLLASIGVERPVVIGHSMGGMLALRYALMYPREMSGLVVVNPIGLEDWKAKGVPFATVDQLFERELKTSFDSIKKYQQATYYGGEWKPQYDRWVSMLAGMYAGEGGRLVAWNQALTSDMVLSQPVIHEIDQIAVPLAGLQEDARDASSAITARLDAVRAQLDSVVGWSESQMAREESSGRSAWPLRPQSNSTRTHSRTQSTTRQEIDRAGGSCGTASGAGRGPLFNARRGVKDSVTTLRDGMVRSWLGPVQAEVDRLRQSAIAGEGSNLLERQRQFEVRAGAIRGEARSIAARSNELGKSTATEMRALGSSVAIASGQAGFSCYDPTLVERLTQAAAQAERPAELTLREASFNEGPAGVANAVKKLWANVGSYLAGAVRYVFSAGRATADTTTGEPISGRDLIALLATIGVDLGLLAMAALNPPPAAPGRRDGLARSHARLRLPSTAVIHQLSTAFETAIAKAPEANLDWMRRHFIHHGACSYFVTPNLYSVGKADEREALRALAINQLAGVLTDLNLIRPLTSWEQKRLARDETRTSYGDLAALRRQHASAKTAFERQTLPWKMWMRQAGVGDSEDQLRNHGLLSKAERTLDIAGWSVPAQRDVEVFRLVDCEGLTPLLALFNAATLAKGVESIEAARQEQELLEERERLQLADHRGA